MISHHHKCIFIHIPKNAGQSVEHVFLDLLNLEWKTRAPLLLRHNDIPEIGPPSLAHLQAKEYVQFKYLTQEMFDQYYKFSFVRNPWSRTVSIYKCLGYNKKIDFKSFLLGTFKDKLFEEKRWFVGPQNEFLYGLDGNLLVDYVGRFEDLQSGFDSVCKNICISPTQLPHVNASRYNERINKSGFKMILDNYFFNYKKKDIPDFKYWQEFYDKETIDCVGRLYEKDIELFDYKFE